MGTFQSFNLKRESLYGQIADSIEEMVAANQLQPGSRLPSERDLAKLLGVNRATVREAIRLLQHRGLVQMKVGSGTFITDVPRSVVTDSIERYVNFGSCTHEDLLVLRSILEPEIAAMAVQHATPEDLASLRELIEQTEAAANRDDAETYARVDATFHDVLAVATHNELIGAIVGGLQKVMQVWIQAEGQTHRYAEGTLGHRLVYEAIVQRDAERARQTMRDHIHVAWSGLLNQNHATLGPSPAILTDEELKR